MSVFGSQIIQTLKKPENLVTVIALIVAVILAIVDIVDANDDFGWTLAAIIFILAELSLSRILASHQSIRRDRQTEELLTLLKDVKIGPSDDLLRFRTKLPSLGNTAGSANNILIVGRSLAGITRNTNFIKNRLQQGAFIRLVMLDFENQSLFEAVSPGIETSTEGLKADLNSALELLKRIASDVPDSKLEIRLINYVPTLSFVLVECDEASQNYIIVELIPYRVGTPQRPHLLFEADKSHDWFIYFRNIAEQVWKDAEYIELNDIREVS